MLIAAALFGVAAAWLWSSPALAASPVKDGWWTITNIGNGFAPPAPPQVPPGGLYVENGFAGPTAISALTFRLAPGDAVGRITLHVAGSPVITQPPVACPITAAGEGYQPAQGGAWSDRPAYDCSVAQVTGAVDANDTTVTFDASPLLHDGTVSAVILAGGSADEIAFEAPGEDALAVTHAGSGGSTASGSELSNHSVGGSAGQAGTGSAAPSQASGAVQAPFAGAGSAILPALPGSPSQALPASPSPALAGGNGGSAPVTSSVSSGQVTLPSQVAGHTAPGRLASTSRAVGGWRRGFAEALGLGAVLLALVAYSEGFGLLGGRMVRTAPAQVCRRRPVRTHSAPGRAAAP